MNKYISTFLCSLLAMAVVLVPDVMLAQTGPATPASGVSTALIQVTEVICAFIEWGTGPLGIAIGTVAIIFLGIGAFFGKVTWGLAIMIALGVVLIFAAGAIVLAIAQSQPGAATTTAACV